jgi:hypothetical protein
VHTKYTSNNKLPRKFTTYLFYLLTDRINAIHLKKKKHLRKPAYANNNGHYFIFISQKHGIHSNEEVTKTSRSLLLKIFVQKDVIHT